MRKDDIVLILSDQHANWALPDKIDFLDAPIFSEMINNGEYFENCVCNSPLCVPSRMSFLGGLLPSDLDILENDTTLKIDQPTIAHAAKISGYEPVLIGRMHFKGDDQLHGFSTRIGQDITSQYWGTGGKNRTDFGPYASTTNRKNCMNVLGGGYSPIQEYDEVIKYLAIEYLRQPSDKPRFIVIGFYGPHFPFVCKSELYEKYKKLVTLDENETPDPVYQELVMHYSDDKKLKAKAAYLGLVEQLDGYVGEIWDELKKMDGSPTLIYTSDHGEQCGKRDIYGKQTLYPEAVKVPLFIWNKNIKPKRYKHYVSLLDLSRSLLDLMDADMPFHKGHSLYNEEPVKIEQYLVESEQFLEAVMYQNIELYQINGNIQAYKDDKLVDNHFEELNKLFLSEEEKIALKDRQKILKENHAFLKKWGACAKPDEWASYKASERARNKPIE